MAPLPVWRLTAWGGPVGWGFRYIYLSVVGVVAYVFFSPTRGVEVREFVLKALGVEALPPDAPPSGVPLVVHGSGGTTWDVVSFVKRHGVRGVVLVGFGEHNSFASALHTKAELEAEGVTAVVYHCPSLEACGEVVRRARRVAEAASSLLGARVALVGSETRQAIVARERFGWAVDVVPLEKFGELVEASEADGEGVALFGEVKAAKIVAALRSLAVGRDAVAIQCFPYLMRAGVTPCLAVALLNARGRVVACEGDLSAAFAMLLSKRLTGYSGWVANAVYRDGAKAVFAHCTISLDMVKSWRLMPHFESGYPMALAGELAHSAYTVVSLSPRLDTIAVGRVEAEKSGNYLKDACRTQAFVKFSREVELERAAPANHHVFMPGDHVEEVEDVARLLSLKVVRY